MSILVIGPGLKVRGGVSTVENHIVASAHHSDRPAHHISSYEDGGLFTKVVAFCVCFFRVTAYLLSSPVTLIHIHFSHRGSTLRKVILFQYLRLFKKPVLMHSHGSDFKEFYRTLPGPARYVVRASLMRAAAVIALSDSWKDFFVSEVGVPEERVIAMPNPVDLISRINPVNDELTQFLFLGRLEKRKGVYDLIDALRLLKERAQLNDIKIVLAGDGETEAVKALLEKHELTSMVEVTGWVSRDSVVNLLQASDVLLLPSYNEGLPMSVLEAMGSGMTVLTTPVGGIPEVVQHDINGLLTEPGDVEQLANKMIQASSKPLQKRLGDAAKLSAQDLSVDNYNRKLAEVYSHFEKR